MDLFDKIQSLDESVKTKILIVGTAIAMIIVIALWYLYFSTIVIGPTTKISATGDQSTDTAVVPTVQAVPAAVQSSAGPSIWQNITGFFTGIGSRIKNLFQTPGQYDIQPSH